MITTFNKSIHLNKLFFSLLLSILSFGNLFALSANNKCDNLFLVDKTSPIKPLIIQPIFSSFIEEKLIFDFVLISNGNSYRLESCIPEDYYSPRLMMPRKSGRTMSIDQNNPPMQVTGSHWENNCLIVEYSDSALTDEEWIDLISAFTILSRDQINLIHKN